MADDIEVTPEMIEAGAAEIRRIHDAYGDWFAGAGDWAKDIYRAMARKAAEQGVDGARRRLIGYNGDAPIYGDPL